MVTNNTSAEWRKRLRTFREDRGWSQKDLGEFLGLSQQMVHALESGDRVPSGPKALHIDVKTDGFVSRSEMRPDIYVLKPGKAA